MNIFPHHLCSYTVKLRYSVRLAICLFLLCQLAAERLVAEIVQLGLGSYTTTPRDKDAVPPRHVYKTEKIVGPLPTNQWWSSALWTQYSERQYPHPLSVRAVEKGLQVYYPGRQIVANNTGIIASMPDIGRRDLLLGHSACESFPDARLDGSSDWFVNVLFEHDNLRMRVSYGHGSPFVFASFDHGTPRLQFEKPPQVWGSVAAGAIIGLSVDDVHYGVFAPTGFTWEGLSTDTWSALYDKQDCVLAIAVLPDRNLDTLNLFARYAYNHVSDTRVRWHYDRSTSTVVTTFEWTTLEMDSPVPREKGTLFCLYPHQWTNTQQPLLGFDYRSVRGPLKVARGTSFTTTTKYSGVLPVLPQKQLLHDHELRAALEVEAAHPIPQTADTYWTGKQLGKWATLTAMASQMEMPVARDQFLAKIKLSLEDWLQADDAAQPNGNFFYYDSRWGTLIGYPASYGSDTQLNDHHLHYGYFLRAAAMVALHDPDWAQEQKWGGMVNLMVRDIANEARDDSRFPLLRCFDAYAGHSWASGHGNFGDGNNLESSSESIQAWCALILWGAATDDRELIDLGVFLYTTEVEAAKCYWFDVSQQFHPPEYRPSVVGQVWGGKSAYGTWFSAGPESIHGINWLPFHGGSLYLGHEPEYVAKVTRELAAYNEKFPDRKQQWRDLVAMYSAFDDSVAARALLEQCRAAGEFEAGNSFAQADYWISNLETLGRVKGDVSADQPLFAVFEKGKRKTYAVYNYQDRPLKFNFSDGHSINSAGRGLTIQDTEQE